MSDNTSQHEDTDKDISADVSLQKNKTKKHKSSTKNQQKAQTVDMNMSRSTGAAGTTSTNKRTKLASNKLSWLAILLSLAIGGGFAYYGHQYIHQQTLTIDALKKQISHTELSIKNNMHSDTQAQQKSFSDQLNALQDHVKHTLSEQKTTISQLTTQTQNALHVQEKTLHALQDKMNAMSKTDTNAWLIAEADYFIKLAGRKIWQDQDYVTASLLLKSADHALIQTNDPSLITIRKAINEDISRLTAINQIDTDGISIKLMQLANQIEQLKFKGIDANSMSSSSVAENGTAQVTTSASDWKQNLKQNATAFLSKFVTIRKHHKPLNCSSENADLSCELLQALAEPQQQAYLRENIRLQLLLATNAITRYHQQSYDIALNNVNTWITTYFEKNDITTKSILKQLEPLRHQQINSQQIPKTLVSAPLIDHLMQTRVHSVLTQTPQIGG